MSRSDLKALEPVRRHRETQAERDWVVMRDRLREQDIALQEARDELIRARHAHQAQRERLKADHQGRTVTLMTLNAWSEDEQRLIADLNNRERAIEVLKQARHQHALEAESAQLQLRSRRKSLEKLKALNAWLSEGVADE